MPAASSGPYQSRIFNFVHQKSRRVSEQIGRTIRHLRVATSWGVQVMLYPIYLLFQTTESAEKRFYSSQQNWRQLPEDELDAQPQTPPATDQAIQRVLHIVKVLPSEALAANPLEESTKPLSLLASRALSRFKFLVFPSPNYPSTPAPHHLTTSFPPIQGVATQLSSHTLVLVTTQNEILDILTPQQQQKLQQRIIEEVANYWCRWMSWVQQDKLTYASPARLAPVKALAFLDQTLAGLESHHLAPLSEVAIALAHHSWQPVLAVATRLTESLSSNTLDGTQRTVVTPRTEHQFRIQALIWAAINYFFGDRGQSYQLGQTAPKLTKSVPQNLVGMSDKLSNPSLKLKGSRLGSLARRIKGRDVGTGCPSPISPVSMRSTPTASAQRSVGAASSDALFAAQESKLNSWHPKGQPLQDSSRKVNDDADSWLTLSDLFEQSSQINPAPDWIETYATAMGYVKHPLERLLQWLDRAMLWLEELLMRVMHSK